MIPEIKKVLYATDLTKNSAYAFRYAIKVSLSTGAKITILHVTKKMDPVGEIPVIVQLGEKRYRQLVEEKKEEVVKRIKKRLEEFAKKELKDEPEGIKRVSSIVVKEGEPAVEILDMAEQEDSDLIIMGSHGKGSKYTFLGSVTQRVLRHIKRPVLVVPIPEGKIDISYAEDDTFL